LEKIVIDAMIRTQERLVNALEELERADEQAAGADLVSVAEAIQAAIELISIHIVAKHIASK
jgi:hypothetical protein